jgi:REP element-mobilizing transposase RayT
MARQLRIEYEGAIYHITARGNERQKIFFTERDYQKFKEYLVIAQERFGCVLHAYVCMGNHYHLILETPEKNLSRMMHYLNSSYTTYINVKRKRIGHLLQGRFKSIVVDKDSYLLELSRYLHLNPVRAGMVERPEDYLYSSYKVYISRRQTDCVRTGMILGMMAKNGSVATQTYREFVESGIGVELDDPLKSVYGGLILGSERFVRQTLDRLDKDLLEDEEITRRKALQPTVGQETILEAVAEYFGCDREDLVLRGNGKTRNIAIYLLKHQCGMTSQEVSRAVGGMSCAAVAKVYQRLRKQLASDEGLKQEVEELKRRLSNVQV